MNVSKPQFAYPHTTTDALFEVIADVEFKTEQGQSLNHHHHHVGEQERTCTM
jgi:hypothetical protein